MGHDIPSSTERFRILQDWRVIRIALWAFRNILLWQDFNPIYFMCQLSHLEISFIFAHTSLFSVVNSGHMIWNGTFTIETGMMISWNIPTRPMISPYENQYHPCSVKGVRTKILHCCLWEGSKKNLNILFKVAKQGYGDDANSIWLILEHVSGIISQIKLQYTLNFSDPDLMDFRFKRQNFWSICHMSVTCEN